MNTNKSPYRTIHLLRSMALAGAMFAFVLCVLITVNYFQIRHSDPLHSPSMKVLTERFRDNPDDEQLKTEIFPSLLAKRPKDGLLRVWTPGCSTGEEAYSLAILLKEEGLYERTQIFATDINDQALAKAEEGVYSLAHLEAAEESYHRAGGLHAFSRYYLTRYDYGIMDSSLRQNIVFAHHNLVSDGVFCEVHLILCRNVFIYFDKTLQNRVMKLFAESFARGGYLCLGAKESLQLSDVVDDFRIIEPKRRIYQYQPRRLPPNTGPAPWMPRATS